MTQVNTSDTPSCRLHTPRYAEWLIIDSGPDGPVLGLRIWLNQRYIVRYT